MVREEYSVSLKSIVEEQGLTVLHAAKDFDSARVYTADVNRPALQLAGFYDYFDPKRLQLIGRVESTYLQTLGDQARLAALEQFMRFDIAALILCHDTQPLRECVELAEKYDRNLLATKEDTSTFMADLISMLRNAMAPRVTLHGVLVEIYGEACSSWATPASARARRRWSLLSAATASSRTTPWRYAASRARRS